MCEKDRRRDVTVANDESHAPLVVVCTHRDDDNVGVRLVCVTHDRREALEAIRDELTRQLATDERWADGNHGIDECELTAYAFAGNAWDWDSWARWTTLATDGSDAVIHWF